MSSLLQFRLIYENGLCNIDIGNKWFELQGHTEIL